MRKLTDKDKLDIIEGFKKEMDIAYDMRKSGTFEPSSKEIKLQFPKDSFDEIDRAWLTEMMDHYGVKHEWI